MKASTLIKIAIAVPIIAALAITVHNFGKIEKNPENTIGNNAGNLLNDGLICEFENKVLSEVMINKFYGKPRKLPEYIRDNGSIYGLEEYGWSYGQREF